MKYNLLERCALCLIYLGAKMNRSGAMGRRRGTCPGPFGIKR
jgi:hypothetical protein